jgi:anti-sigma factor RsiW
MTTHLTDDQLIDYLHGELAPGEDAAFALHLSACDGCRERYDDEAHLSEDLRAYARAAERELPVGIRAAVWDAIERPAGPRWGFAWLRPAFALPVAAALVVVAFAGFSVSHHGSTPAIDAAYYLDDHAALTGAVPFNEGNTVPAALMTTQSDDTE